jgi:hypothetical protein
MNFKFFQSVLREFSGTRYFFIKNCRILILVHRPSIGPDTIESEFETVQYRTRYSAGSYRYLF